MDPTKALELSSQYGVAAVILFIVVFYLGGLIYYVLKQNREREKEQSAMNKEREERLAKIIEVHIQAVEDKTNERHLSNQQAMAILAEADRRQREEHETMIKLQNTSEKQHETIARILERILTKLKMEESQHA